MPCFRCGLLLFGLFLGLAGVTLAASGLSLIDRLHAVDPCTGGSLSDVDHFVLLMQENRSFDHYFGTLSDVLGFECPLFVTIDSK